MEGQPALYEGPTRRVMHLPDLAADVVRLGFRGGDLRSVMGTEERDLDRLSEIVARLTLAGLVQIED